METKREVLNGKPNVGNSHIRFDEGEVTSAKPRRGSLLYKTLKLKKIVAVAVAAVGISVLANPSVTDVTVANGDTWSSKKVSFTVSGVEDWKYYLGFDVMVNGVTKTVDGGVAYNNSYSGVVIDTKEIFGELKTDSEAKIKVWVSKIEPSSLSHVAVQLWEDGPYWAICNVDASSPTDAGSYFWWGDTAGQKPNDTTFATRFESNAPTQGKTIAELKSAGYIDTTGNLAPAHDAATLKLGVSWRMPTSDEIQLLFDRCNRSWDANKKGYIVNGKGKYASRSIFLPAAGYGMGGASTLPVRAAPTGPLLLARAIPLTHGS